MQNETEKTASSVESPIQTPYIRGRYYEDDKGRFAVTIRKPQSEVYAFWRNLENLPLFMKDLKSVDVLTPSRSKWTVELDAGMQTTWEADILSERPGEMISWQSVEGSSVETSGSVWFSPAPAGRGTVVSLRLDYTLPGGKITEVITKMMGEDPESLALINLRRLKALLETGEIPTIEGQSSGRDEDLQEYTTH